MRQKAGRQAGRHGSRLQNKHVLRIHKLAAKNSAQICRCKSKKNKKNETKQNKRLRSKKPLPAATFSNNENDTTSRQN
jgi:hypothetical protein